MSLTNFPQGISSFGMPVLGMGEETMTTGNVFFVDSGATNASDANAATDPLAPAATIDGCIAKCTANNGDIIFVMPGHTETLSNFVAMDVAGVWVRGLGWGNDRPTLTGGNAIACFSMSAASTRVSNVILQLDANTATVANGFLITAAGTVVENCEIKPHATSQFTNFLTATDVEDVVIRNNRFIALTTGAGSTSGVVLDGCDRAQMYGNQVLGNFGEHALDNTTPAAADEVLDFVCIGNLIRNYSATGGDLAVEMDANATGVFAHNLLGTGLDFAAGFTPGNVRLWENYMADTDDQSAGLIPSVSAT